MSSPRWCSDQGSFDYRFRFVLVGDSTVGKSSLLKYFICAQFSHDTEPTVGVDFFVRTLDLDDGVRIKLQLWDTAGQERFRSITSSYFRNCAGILLIFDLTKRISFNHVPGWMNECKQHANDVTFTLIGHKADLEAEREVTKREASLFADFHDMNYFETSSVDGQNISEAMSSLTNSVYQAALFKDNNGGDFSNSGITKGRRESVVQLNGNGMVTKGNVWGVAKRSVVGVGVVRGNIVEEAESSKDKCCNS